MQQASDTSKNNFSFGKSSSMVVQHKDEESTGMFYVTVDGTTHARMTYTKPTTNLMQIEHTEVDAELRNDGVGYKMVASAVQFARNNNLKIVPLCPFVAAVFKKKPEYEDVLSPKA